MRKLVCATAGARGALPMKCELTPAWLEYLPKKNLSDTPDAPKPRGPRAKRQRAPLTHDAKSLRIGEGPGYGGFQNPIYGNAIQYFREAGTDASHETIIAALWRVIEAAPKAQGRSVERYRPGAGDLERQVRRACEYVKQERSSLSESEGRVRDWADGS